ncbi:MAG: ABC transporter substrate-binding protein [Pseudoflavonifractor sp.]
MKKAKKWLALSLATVMSLTLLSGCGPKPAPTAAPTTAPTTAPSTEPAPPAEGGVLRFGADSEPTGFDPHTISEEASLRVINQLYETLVERDKDMNFYGELAESWEIPDPTTYIFKLRQGVKFHSGREFTAEDVKYSYDRVLGKSDKGDIGALGNKASYFKGITNIEVVDPYTVKFTIDKPNAAFLSNLTSNYGAIVDKDVIDKDGDLMRGDGGTGPFALKEWKPDNYVELTKFADYWDAGKPKLDGITYFLIGDEAARLAALRTGDIDIANLSANSIAAVKDNADISVLDYQTNSYIAVGCNLSTPALQDKNVRQAMSYAMDRQGIIDYVFNGSAEITSMMPPAMGHWSKDVSGMDLYTPNMTKAQELMKTAGYGPDKHLTLKVAAGLMDSIRDTAVVLQQQFSECYIDLEITNMESGEYVDVWGKMSTPEAGYDLMVVQDGSGTDPNRAISFFYGTGAGANVWGYSDAKVDELCAKGIATTDEAERQKYYDEAQDICIEDCTKICVASPMMYFFARSNVTGFEPTAINASNFRDTYFK